MKREGIFISYARGDGAPTAAELRQQLAEEKFTVWQDRVNIEGGREWWLQITEALDQVAYMILVLTPRALASTIVRKEWRYARQQGVCVYLVKGTADLDLGKLPRWMSDQHIYDFFNAHDRAKLTADLNKTPDLKRVPFMAEDLPADFVQRPGEFDELIRMLLGETREDPVAITAALRGAGGYGKTTLAKAVCHDERIQDAFDDGVLWVTLGETPGDLTGRVEDLIYTLSGHRPGFTGVDAASARLVELLADRDLLLVIDDVWNGAHLRPFTQGGPRCARLITTRNLDTLPGHAQKVKVDAMRQDEAVALLSAGLGLGEGETWEQGDGGTGRIKERQTLFDSFRKLAKRLGEWPLLLRLVNSALRNRVENDNKPLPDALVWVNQALDKRGLTYFDARDSQASRQAVKQTIGISLDLLTEADRARYAELAIFPEDVEIPLATLEKLWGKTGNLDEFDTEDLCMRLNRLSLLVSYDASSRWILLHDVVRSFLIEQQRDRLTELHNHLLDAHRSARWAELPDDEPYLWDYLVFHLIEAQRGEELVAAVKDWRYLAKKTLLRKSPSVEKDMLQALPYAPENDPLRTLLRGYSVSSHLFNRCRTLSDLEATLVVRLQQFENIKIALQELVDELQATRIASLYPLPDVPHPALLHTFEGHSDSVWSCSLSPNDMLLASASSDRTLKIWDFHTGQCLRTLEGHTSILHCCAFSPDGERIVSASRDNTLRVWDWQTGQCLHSMGHSGWVNSCAYSPDGKWIISASSDDTIKVWNAQTGQCLRTLKGHEESVMGCAFSSDGRQIVSASSEAMLKIWDWQTGECLQTLKGHSGSVYYGSFSPDGQLVVSASYDRTLKVWNAQTGQCLYTLRGHSAPVYYCCFSPDGYQIVSASYDCTLRVWDSLYGNTLKVFKGHSSSLWGCVFSRDGSQIVSTSRDKTIKVWDASSNDTYERLVGHAASVNDCAFSLDGKQVISASDDGTLKIWDVTRGEVLHTLRGHSDSVVCSTFSPSGSYLASASSDRMVIIWDAKSGKLLKKLEGHFSRVHGWAFSHDEKLIVTASWDNTIRLWDIVEGNEQLKIKILLFDFNNLATRLDTQFAKLASRFLTRKITLTRKVVYSGAIGVENSLGEQEDYESGCAFSLTGEFIAAPSVDSTVKIWDVVTGKLSKTLKGHLTNVTCCVFSPDGKLLASSSHDRSVKIWNVRTGDQLCSLEGHLNSVRGCAFSSDGKHIVSASYDQTLKVWDVVTGNCLTTFYADGELYACAMHGDLIVAGGQRGVYFLKLVK